MAVLVLCALEASKAPRLSVAVAIVSGLDPATDLARPAVDPQFNLTLRVASRSLLSRACVGVSSTAVAVSYHGVRLASAPVAPRVCAARRKSADAGPFVAWGSSVRLPGFARDSLAADMRNGAAAFDVALMDGHLVVCRGRRAGDADALQARLDPRGNGCGGAAHGNVKRLAVRVYLCSAGRDHLGTVFS